MADKISVNTAIKIGSIARSVWRDGGQEMEFDGPRNGHHHRKIYEFDNAKVCLTCIRKICNGGEDCFASRKKELKGGG